jgi:hypothetical protein
MHTAPHHPSDTCTPAPDSGNVKLEPGAVVCRVARSFVRFGSFQLPASRGGGDLPLVRALADHVIRRHFPHLLGAPGRGERVGKGGVKEKEDAPV